MGLEEEVVGGAAVGLEEEEVGGAAVGLEEPGVRVAPTHRFLLFVSLIFLLSSEHCLIPWNYEMILGHRTSKSPSSSAVVKSFKG